MLSSSMYYLCMRIVGADSAQTYPKCTFDDTLDHWIGMTHFCELLRPCGFRSLPIVGLNSAWTSGRLKQKPFLPDIWFLWLGSVSTCWSDFVIGSLASPAFY